MSERTDENALTLQQIADLVALVDTGAVRLERDCAAQETMRPIDLDGSCDGCGFAGRLVLAVDVPARGDCQASEPWLCKDCADLQRYSVTVAAALPRLLMAAHARMCGCYSRPCRATSTRPGASGGDPA